MFLNIKGIGKIHDSTIEMRGITVIAGENNTGKSTFGKALYCVFNSFYNIDRKVTDERIEAIRNIITRDYFLSNDKIHLSDQLIGNILNLKNDFSVKNFHEILINSSKKISEEVMESIYNINDKYINEIERYVNFKDTVIKEAIISRFFRNEFLNQINHVNRPDNLGVIKLVNDEKTVQIDFLRNECINFEDNIGIIHNAILIDTPFILDDAGNNILSIIPNLSSNYHRNNLLHRIVKNNESTVIAEAMAKQKLKKILEIIDPLTKGIFIKTEDSLVFKEKLIEQPLVLRNISNGMKIFLIVKRLLEQNEIQEQDVLIFDEPEIHLHPDWQIKFAEMIVLLQKEFNLTILLTTHSPYFLHAVEVYTVKHKTNDSLKCYLAESKDDTSGIHDVTETIDTIYKQLARSFQKLEDDQYEY